MSEPILEVQNLRTYFFTEEGVVRAVDGVSLDLRRGETLGLVGESGCGKSVTSLSIMRLIPDPPGKIVGGKIIYKGENLLEKDEEYMRHIRGNEIAMIFQDPMTSLNPVFRVGDQIAEAIQLHQGVGRKEALRRAVEMMKLVRIPLAEQRAREYPHQFSGGMRQRIMIAMALSCNPEILIADEPSTALDVTIQAQILEIMKTLQRERGMSILLITHDLGVIAEMSDRVAVMYAGVIVEYADVKSLFKQPLHPYTRGLLTSIPSLATRSKRLNVIEGTVPSLIDPPPGCRFHPRCPRAMPICSREKPELKEVGENHSVACFLY
ncbi:MAG: ABC transporter ATP-binding protein [Methanobacteriota archaeon]|nr:MAG: ABC transporter ATP-binding protein [Euryarchaeota archaeon]